MSLREDMWKYEQITGESAEHVPIIKLGAFLDGYEKGLKALEQQPCEDAISREAAINAIYGCYIGGKEKVENAPINDLYAEGLADAVDAIWELPSVQPTRPTGKWKKYLDEGGFLQCECSNCGLITNEPDNYCPNCGCRVKGEE